MFKKILNVKISLLYVIAPVLAAALFFLFLRKPVSDPQPADNVASVNINSNTEIHNPDCGDNSFRLKGFQYIKPLVNESRDCESARYAPLKERLKNMIDDETKAGNITTASVYIKSFAPGEDWTSVNSSTEYHPASLGKIPILITYLKKSETSASLLEKEVAYLKDSRQIPSQNFNFDSIKVGRRYKIKELLYYMIANSDNHATCLLQDNIDFPSFRQTFTDLGMDANKLIDTNYKFKAKEFSIFLEAIFNAGYLNMTSSEYASSLLAQCKFRDGILKKLPPQVKAIHKFGEYASGDNKELHESAIIYIDNTAYIITIMTKGHDFKNLSDLMGQISKMVYDYMNTSV